VLVNAYTDCGRCVVEKRRVASEGFLRESFLHSLTDPELNALAYRILGSSCMLSLKCIFCSYILASVVLKICRIKALKPSS
ncbi:hypothetical protein A2U01_0000847, partial [Trifolium medium]|nr:hypothetical protein [Trifolium medium]